MSVVFILVRIDISGDMSGQIEGYAAIAAKKLQTRLFLIPNPQNSSNPALRINKFQTLDANGIQLLSFFIAHKIV